MPDRAAAPGTSAGRRPGAGRSGNTSRRARNCAAGRPPGAARSRRRLDQRSGLDQTAEIRCAVRPAIASTVRCSSVRCELVGISSNTTGGVQLGAGRAMACRIAMAKRSLSRAAEFRGRTGASRPSRRPPRPGRFKKQLILRALLLLPRRPGPLSIVAAAPGRAAARSLWRSWTLPERTMAIENEGLPRAILPGKEAVPRGSKPVGLAERGGVVDSRVSAR